MLLAGQQLALNLPVVPVLLARLGPARKSEPIGLRARLVY
jgi:hypothetical protein